ncbi:MAG: hypothetical protein IJW28_04480 [Clostridia bacterium]|nr:hypothetical protein [Clostridia bacterium]
MPIIKCDKCNKKFSYHESMNNFPGGLDKEDIYCPYCGHSNLQIMTSGLIVTQPVKENEYDK